MATTLVRVLAANTLINGATYGADTILNLDSSLAARLVKRGAVVSIQERTMGVDDNAASTHKFGCILALAGAAQTLDLTNLAAAGSSRAGTSTNFTAVHTLKIRNLGTGTMTVTVGAAASQAFTGPLAGTGPTIAVPAGESIILQTSAAAGWTTSSKNNLKLDPGADTFKATVAIGGIGV